MTNISFLSYLTLISYLTCHVILRRIRSNLHRSSCFIKKKSFKSLKFRKLTYIKWHKATVKRTKKKKRKKNYELIYPCPLVRASNSRRLGVSGRAKLNGGGERKKQRVRVTLFQRCNGCLPYKAGRGNLTIQHRQKTRQLYAAAD